MSQPPGPGGAPEFRAPPGYGGELSGGSSVPPARPVPDYFDQPGSDPGGYASLGLDTPPWGPQPSAPQSGPDIAGPDQDLLPPRPAGIVMAATFAATASLQWICALSFAWLVSTAGVAQLGTAGVDGGIYHILNRFNYRMVDGLAWPLYFFPLASFLFAFLLLARRPWARTVFTAVGAAALVWSAWWLRGDLQWWLVPAVYIGVTILVPWTADARRWYAWRPSDPAGQPF